MWNYLIIQYICEFIFNFLRNHQTIFQIGHFLIKKIFQETSSLPKLLTFSLYLQSKGKYFDRQLKFVIAMLIYVYIFNINSHISFFITFQ